MTKVISFYHHDDSNINEADYEIGYVIFLDKNWM